MEFTLIKIATEEFSAIISQLPDKFLGDFENGCVCSGTTLEKDSWVKLTTKSGDAHRLIHCVPHPQIHDNQLLITKEDAYFNICRVLNLNALDDTNEVILQIDLPHIKDYFPPVADSVKISPILTSCDFTNEDEESLLHSYFTKPKYLCVGDTIQMSITKGTFTRCPSYRGVSEVYFRVISASFSGNNEEKNSDGFYAMKGYSDLYCLTGSSSFLPPKSMFLRRLARPTLTRVPPDLEQYVSKLRTLFSPFTKTSHIGCQPFFILTGASGSGKLVTINLVGQMLGLHVISISAYEFCNIGVSAFETKLDYILKKSIKIGPCILAITNLELMGRDKQGHEDPRLIDSFLSRCMSALKSGEKNPLLLVGVTDSKTDDILPSISRAAVQLIKFQLMDPSTALESLIWMATKRGLGIDDSKINTIVKKLTGFLHSDLNLLLDHAVRNKHSRTPSDKLDVSDFQYALDLTEKAYSDTIGVAKVPDVKWDDVGGLTEVKEEIKHTLNMTSEAGGGRLRRSGILFYGPPGTGKTLMAKAVATECSMNFLSVKGPELMNMYVGQSERNVREVFERGREAAPCILFFDELDSLAPNRGKSDGGGVTDRVVSQLLAEMDGLHSNRGLFVIAATNRPDLVDSALLRPGRFDKMFYLGPLANTQSKLGVLKALTSRFALSSDADLKGIAEACPDCVTGADLYSVCSNAWLSSARRSLTGIPKGEKVPLPLQVSMEDFMAGISQMVPSLTAEDLLYYQQLASSTSNK